MNGIIRSNKLVQAVQVRGVVELSALFYAE